MIPQNVLRLYKFMLNLLNNAKSCFFWIVGEKSIDDPNIFFGTWRRNDHSLPWHEWPCCGSIWRSFTQRTWRLPSGKHTKKRWNITLFMGKSTISTGPFSSSQTVNVSQRVTIWTVDTITQGFTGRRYITQLWSYQITPSLGGFLCGNPLGGWARSFAHQKG